MQSHIILQLLNLSLNVVLQEFIEIITITEELYEVKLECPSKIVRIRKVVKANLQRNEVYPTLLCYMKFANTLLEPRITLSAQSIAGKHL